MPKPWCERQGRRGDRSAVGLMRRFFPAVRTLKAMLEARIIGEVRRFHCFEGGTFRWPVRSSSYFERETSGGGVLMDLGPHLLDLLLWWLGTPSQVAYADDAMGGVEANCRICLSYEGFAGEVRLSRDWYRPNRYVFEGTAGTLAWTVPKARPARPHLARHRLSLGAGPARRRARISAAAGSAPRTTSSRACRTDWHAIAAARGARSSIVDGAEALASLRLIEHCYRHRKLLPLHWMGEAELRAAHELVTS